MSRRALTTCIILTIAWLLMLSYQIFTETALTALAASLHRTSSFIASAITANINLFTFICSFAWMFVLSSIISNLIFGKQRRFSIQFLISLFLTLAATAIIGTFKTFGIDLSNPNTLLQNPLARVFNNSLFAFFYLSLPFIFMIALDLHALTRQHK